MTRLLAITLLILISTIAFSQQNIFGIYFSPTVNYRSLDDKYDFLDERDEKEHFLNCGLSYELMLGKKFSILTGLDYSVEGYKRYPVWPQEYYIYGQRYALHYLGIPIEVNYNFFQRDRIMIGLHAGVNFRQLFKVKVTALDVVELPLKFGGNSIPPEEVSLTSDELKEYNYNMFNLGAMAGVRISYTINNFRVGLSPEFRYALMETTKGQNRFHPENERLYSYGLRLIFAYAKKN